MSQVTNKHDFNNQRYSGRLKNGRWVQCTRRVWLRWTVCFIKIYMDVTTREIQRWTGRNCPVGAEGKQTDMEFTAEKYQSKRRFYQNKLNEAVLKPVHPFQKWVNMLGTISWLSNMYIPYFVNSYKVAWLSLNQNSNLDI